jgi:hypothetical protein
MGLVNFSLVVGGLVAVTACIAAVTDSISGEEVCTSNATKFWAVSKKGFLSARKSPESMCSNPLISPLCKTLAENPTTENIALSLQGLFDMVRREKPDLQSRYQSDPEDVEDIFSWLGMATCRVAYNHNPVGDYIGAPAIIPKQLAVPLLEYAKAARREPFVAYAAMVLDNCMENSTEESQAPSYADWNIIRTITSKSANEAAAHRAEKGFYATHCAVERNFGETVRNLQRLKDHGPCQNLDTCGELYIDLLRKMAFNIRNGASYLRHMRHFYNPSHFYSELRPFIKCGNVAENGMIFEMDEETKSEYDIILNNNTVRKVIAREPVFGIRGPSGAGTTSLPSIDAGLQITTSIQSNHALETAMREFRQFHPHDHYKLNDELREIRLRDTVIYLNNSDLIDAYNDAIVAVAQFRDAHVEHIGTYIIKSVKHIPPQEIKGTGNTPMVKYLCESFFGTLRSLIPIGASPNLPVISVDSICFAECLTGHYSIHTEEYCALFNSTMALLN